MPFAITFLMRCDGIRPRDPRDFRGNKIKADAPLFMTLYKDRATPIVTLVVTRCTEEDTEQTYPFVGCVERSRGGWFTLHSRMPEALEEWRSRRDNDDILPCFYRPNVRSGNDGCRSSFNGHECCTWASSIQKWWLRVPKLARFQRRCLPRLHR